MNAYKDMSEAKNPYGLSFELIDSASIDYTKIRESSQGQNAIVLGVEVTTIGGIVGHVVNIKDDNITIETSMDKTLMEFKNWAIREVKKLESDDEE